MRCNNCIHYDVCYQYDITDEDENEMCALYESKRPHGKWEHWGSPFTDDTIANSIVCSICKARYVEIEGEIFNFCPNCGADMREGEEE